MSHHQPHQVTGFHSCDRIVGLAVLNGEYNLNPSINSWDWLGNGIYFWEQNPYRALSYAQEVSNGKQKNHIRIKTPFVIGTTITLGNCLNLLEPQSIEIIQEAYEWLKTLYEITDQKLPENKGANRKLDCAVIKAVHEIAKRKKRMPYDTVRCPFPEGDSIFPNSNFTKRGHIEICVINPEMIKGYYLPRPINLYNPYL